MAKVLALQPILSEKSHALSHQRTYLLEVPKSADKLSIARAVKEQFGVEVSSVRSANLSGKQKMAWQRRRRSTSGKTQDTKRAYVTLQEGSKLPFFEDHDHDHDHEHEHEAKPKKTAKESK